MSSSVKLLDPAFQGVGQKPGTEIWRIENFQPVPLPKSDYGKFYMGDSYIVLQTTPSKGGSYLYDIHFWIGKDTSQDEAGTAAIKTVELDAVLGGRAVQHRELQGHESDKFLSYFKPCIIPLEGGIASGFKKPEEEEFETRLYVCRGKRVVRLKQIPFARSSLNHDDVFILDTQNKIYQFNGANSNIQERAKALEVIQFLKEKYHDGTCNVAIVDDGKLDTESDSGEFWVLFGGFAPIGKKVTSEDDVIPETIPAKLYRIKNVLMVTIIKANIDELNFLCITELRILLLVRVDQKTRITVSSKRKVAAFLKQQGVGVKGMSKSAPVNEEVPPLLEGGGKMEVWCINGSAKTPLPKEDIGKFYSGDCYIVLYTYHSGDRKEDYFLCCWIGKDSIEEDRKMAARLANTMFNSLKGRPVQGRVFEGKEPPQFIALFQPMVVLKGGLSTGYKKNIADKGLTDESYTADCVALFRISGTSIHNNKALQVDAAATSLNSNECFLLQSGSSIFTWHGNQSTYEQQQLAAKVAEFFKPGVALKHAREGTETSTFWFGLGEKQSYTSKKASFETVRDPHLFTFSLSKGKFEVEEVYNFSQDDLLTEDVLILDTHAEVFVWVGQSVDTKEKQNVFGIGQKYIDMAACLEGLSPNVPLYRVTEGMNPASSHILSWDFTRATVQGNSFQKKVALLFGASHAVESNGNQGVPTQRASALAALSSALAALSSACNPSSAKSTLSDRSNGNQGGPTQRASALAALSSAFNTSSGSKTSTPKPSSTSQGSQRAAAVAALCSVLTAEKKKQSPDASPTKSTSSTPAMTSPPAEAKSDVDPSEAEDSREVAEAHETDIVSETNGEDEIQQYENGSGSTQSTFRYEQLKAKSENPVTGIDFKRREAYLSDEEFRTVFRMAKEAFYKLPKWKQDMLKKKADLF
ncbi:villin-2-like [Durio zibethinus]|uniref:Villin-2-like n=1 Tax=Durio zibethinus TaxID=66656 RepID=A0A6P5Z580_DURZI|nr:villin-2-like [Durio zibethinus]